MEFDATAGDPGELKPVRGCDGCTLCCKLMSVQELHKPANTWCVHCRTGVGCGIYETRPTACRVFHCGYLLIPALTPEWKPAVSRLILTGTGVNRIHVRVDPARPDAWRRQPYYRAMKQWATEAVKARKQVVVVVGQRSIVLLPDHDVDLGVVGEDEVITVVETATATGTPAYEAYAVKQSTDAGARIAAAKGTAVPLSAAGGEGFRKGRTVP